VSVSAWEAIFMLLVLKIPLIYLAIVVLWAVRAEPEIADGGDEAGVLAPVAPCGWTDWQRRRTRRPGRVPVRPRGSRPPVRAGVS
jgi:hypothetical protein